jgi:putative copper resistance protein D
VILFQPEGGLPLSLARASCVAGQLSLFGVLAFRTLVAPRLLPRADQTEAARIRRHLLRLAQLSAETALIGLLLWLALQTADLASTSSLPQTLTEVPVVLTSTTFGHIVVLQFLALLAILATIGRRDHPIRQRIAFALGLVELGLQAGHSHAYAMNPGPNLLLAADLVHLWAAGAWLGGLLPLLLLVRDSRPRLGAAAARWFSPLGKLCVGALAASALFQGWILIASIPGLIDTAYGWMALIKLALFGVLFAFAVANRYWLAPALLHPDPAAAKRRLTRSIAVQTGFGLAIVIAAALLSNLPPPMHQPVSHADVTPLTFAARIKPIRTHLLAGGRHHHAE